MIQLRTDLLRVMCTLYCVSAGMLISFTSTHAQDITRRSLEHKDYDVWNTLSRASLSNDGKWAIYGVQNGATDGESALHVHHVKTGREYVIERGTDARMTSDSRFLIYRITPEKKLLKRLRKENKKGDELPKPVLQILELENGEIEVMEDVRSFRLPDENGDWLVCLMEKPDDDDSLDDQKPKSREVYEVTKEGLKRPKKKLQLKSREQLALERGEKEREVSPPKESSQETESTEGDDSKNEKKKSAGSPLMLIDLRSGIRRTFPNAVDYEFSKDGSSLAFTTSIASEDIPNENGKADATAAKEDESSTSTPGDGVHVITLASMERRTIAEGTGDYKGMTFSDDGRQIAFLTNKDDYQAETPAWSVYLSSRVGKAKSIASEGQKGMKSGWWVSPRSSQTFSEDGRRLFFDTAPIPEEVLEERAAKAEGRKVKEEDDEDKAKLDIWHWQDPQLQPQQLLQAAAERGRDYRATYVVKSRKILQLADREIPYVSIDYQSTADIAVANTDQKYQKMLSWEVPGFQDVFLIDLNTGEKQLVLESVKWSASLSPNGKFVYWFDKEQKAWFAKSTTEPKAKTIELSKGIKHPLQDELHDTPNLASAYGAAGWLQDDSGLLIYDRFDIWQVDPLGKAKPVCITQGQGRNQEIRFRYLRLDRERRAIEPSESIMLSALDRQTKASGFYSLTIAPEKETETEKAKPSGPKQLIMLDEYLSGLQKSKESNTVLFTRSTFRMCPDLWSSTTQFQEIERVSDINPQQEDYSWGSAELVHWKADDGQPLDGILLQPDDFDPNKKYPLLVYFYERNSDNLHRYYTPAAGRSIICHSFYVSRGYLIFIPDIPYKTGEPGPSAANSILPGVRHLIAQGFVDEDHIGMQGHSWGGYQTAYLVTQTDMFACAESGAPVSNMTSAYGGIRWGSGRSRMFQYEQTQSRIGNDLWAARDKYIANSPLFFADKINTPLLILHNDDDGAVPWYQGIELFVALRRLEKPAWMLNYNDNPHWVMGDANRRDFAIRMQQFFDHYLKDAPEPEWMAVGVPAVAKGENFGLELLEAAAEQEAAEKEAAK